MATAKLKTRDAVIAEIEAELAELEEVESLLKNKDRRVYVGFSGGIMVEMSADEALDYIERKKALLRTVLERIKGEAAKS